MFACVAGSGRAVKPASREMLVALARDFSPRIEFHGASVFVVDISGLGRMFGTPQAVGEALRHAAADCGLTVHIAVAATRTAAVLLATARAGLTMVPEGGEEAALAPLPLRTLGDALLERGDAGEALPAPGVPRRQQAPGRDVRPGPASGGARARGRGGQRNYRLAPAPHSVTTLPFLQSGSSPELPGTYVGPTFKSGDLSADRKSAAHPYAEALSTLKRWGLETLGDLAALPSSELFERLGPIAITLQRIARGGDPGPLVPDRFDEPFEASLDLEWPIEGLEPLSFVLGRVLEPLCARLEREDCGAATLHVHLRLVTRETHTRSLQLPAPIRDPRVLRTLALLNLESHPQPASIASGLRSIRHPARLSRSSLIERALPAPEQLSTLLARLQALMGEDRCGSPVLLDTHRPGAFAMRAFAPVSGNAATTGLWAGNRIATALRRFRIPLAARVRIAGEHPVYVGISRNGFTGGRVERHAGPWRTSGGWWDRASPASEAPARQPDWNREEWDVALSDGGVYRIYQDRDTERWFVEGVVD